jgi:glucose-1-phosphate thymidylyltransferase
MDKQSLKIVVPMAGFGSRLRPHTWSKPKQLASVAGKTVLDYLIDSFASYPGEYELVNIIGYLGDQIEQYIRDRYPDRKSFFVEQAVMRGQSDAIKLASEYLEGPMLVVFADTLIETDLRFLIREEADAVAWVKPVPDPRRFGVAELNAEGYVTRLIEKPQDMDNNLVVVGFYYFKDAAWLLRSIDEQIERGVQLKGEYFIADAVNIMLEQGMRMKVNKVETWLDAGTPEALLATNQYLLEQGNNNSDQFTAAQGFTVVPPVYIHPLADIQSSVIGPNVSIGRDTVVLNAIIRNSIIESDTEIKDLILEDSLVGSRVSLHGSYRHLNIGDDSKVSF